MIGVIFGALLVLAGVVWLVAEPLWHGRLSGGRPIVPGKSPDTLEPLQPAGGFSFKANRVGLVLFAGGAVLLLASSLS